MEKQANASNFDAVKTSFEKHHSEFIVSAVVDLNEQSYVVCCGLRNKKNVIPRPTFMVDKKSGKETDYYPMSDMKTFTEACRKRSKKYGKG